MLHADVEDEVEVIQKMVETEMFSEPICSIKVYKIAQSWGTESHMSIEWIEGW